MRCIGESRFALRRVSVGFIELFVIGVGLSMDAFAVAVCKGLGMKW